MRQLLAANLQHEQIRGSRFQVPGSRGRTLFPGPWPLAPGPFLGQGILQPLPLLHVSRRDPVGHTAHAAEVGRALGDADGPPRVQHIEQLRTLQVVVVGRGDEAGVEAAVGLALIGVVDRLQRVHVGHVEVVVAVLDLRLQQRVAITHARAVVHLPHTVLPLQRQGDAVEAIGDLDRDGVEVEAAGLLEVGVLGDLLPVEPHLPAQPPRAEGRRLPVVLDKADVVLARVDADGLQALQVEFDRVAGVGLQDDLQLVVLLHPVGVLAEAAVVGADARLDVDDVPRLRAEDAQDGGRVHRARADLHVVRLPDEAALFLPVLQQAEDHLLEVESRHSEQSAVFSRSVISRSVAGGGGGLFVRRGL